MHELRRRICKVQFAPFGFRPHLPLHLVRSPFSRRDAVPTGLGCPGLSVLGQLVHRDDAPPERAFDCLTAMQSRDIVWADIKLENAMKGYTQCLAGLIAILLLIAGCATPAGLPVSGAAGGDTITRVYSGPPRPSHEIGILSVPNVYTDIRVRSIDSLAIEHKRMIHLLPGERLIEVRCKKLQPRDPLGSWKGHEFLQVDVQAGHKYEFRSKTMGPGRSYSHENHCTTWLVDTVTGETVSKPIFSTSQSR